MPEVICNIKEFEPRRVLIIITHRLKHIEKRVGGLQVVHTYNLYLSTCV